MKNIIFGGVVLAMGVGILAYMPTAYVNEQCAHMASLFAEKQENPEMYPGLELTANVQEACPSIDAVSQQSSSNSDRDIWSNIEAFQTEARLRAIESDVAF